MASSRSFFKRPNVYGGLLIVLVAYWVPRLLAGFWPDTYKELRSGIIGDGDIQVGTIDNILIIGGILWMLGPKFYAFFGINWKEERNFWRQPHSLAGVILMAIGWLTPIAVAMYSIDAYKVIYDTSIITFKKYKFGSVDNLIVIIGFISLLWPRIKELWPRISQLWSKVKAVRNSPPPQK